MLNTLKFCSDPIRKATLFAQRGESKFVFTIEKMATPEIPGLADKKRSKDGLWICSVGDTDFGFPNVKTVEQTFVATNITGHFVKRIIRI